MKVKGDKAILSFDSLLVVNGDKLTGFTISGSDGKFHNAEAQEKGNKVVVWSSDVAHPVAVRYGWANYPVVNLFNNYGLPASPFRTDRDVAPFQPTQF
jgi:sialate O-acetylesterase